MATFTASIHKTTRIGSTEPFQAIHHNGNAQDGWIMNDVVVNSDAPDNRAPITSFTDTKLLP